MFVEKRSPGERVLSFNCGKKITMLCLLEGISGNGEIE